MMRQYSVAVVGGGVLGTAVAYFLSCHVREPGSVILLEQEQNIGAHTSSRNTGKVHAPFLYDPVAKKTFARAAALGYEMWQTFAERHGLVFKRDGVLEVAVDDSGEKRLAKYMVWGEANGLKHDELTLLGKAEAKAMEPNVRCHSAIYCSKDASVDYGSMTLALHTELKTLGCELAVGHKVIRIANDGGYTLDTSAGLQVRADYVVNVAGGNSMDIAHSMGIASEYSDIHFRGEYWQAPEKYRDLTKLSIYSVPKHPEYPFLDPHWIVRADGRREVGPNAVPVFGPYAYTWRRNLADMIPKLVESSRTGARRAVLDRKFLSLASTELRSAISKKAMIERVREFLPALNASSFTRRGTSGIRSSVVDGAGRFVPDTMILWQEGSVHVLNYNSPGATGALPVAASLAAKILEQARLPQSPRPKSLWDAAEVAERMQE